MPNGQHFSEKDLRFVLDRADDGQRRLRITHLPTGIGGEEGEPLPVDMHLDACRRELLAHLEAETVRPRG
jgi:hypothetical protein